ncbi:MAG: serine O-acetyltransferase [Candidatus Melainabacteria bacterium]|nr:serine O-acetyltransferase [Candidatus Melainabacteria bacterium]
MLFWLNEEIKNIQKKDPASTSWIEVLFCYPGLHALISHKAAHFLYKTRIPILPRFISHVSRWLTGIEIHPGAKLGKRFFIDHGKGVVIGETSEVGNDVVIYQGVTLGGTSTKKVKRHPTLGNNIVVGCGAKILGNIKIGDNCQIGANSVVIRDVPANSTVVGIPARIVVYEGRKISERDPLNHNLLPDPEADAIKCLVTKIKELEEAVKLLSKETNTSSQVDKILDQQPLPKFLEDNGREPKKDTIQNIDDYIHGMGI